MTIFRNLFGVGITAAAGEGLNALLGAGGFLGYLGAVAMTGCIHVVVLVAIAAGTSVGGVTLIGTGRFSYDRIILMTGCGDCLIGSVIANGAVLVGLVTVLGTGGCLGFYLG